MTGAVRVAVGLAIVTALSSSASEAQVIGTFRWQMLPYCNVVTFTVVQTGSAYALHGTDDQCGSSAFAASVTGVAFAFSAIMWTFIPETKGRELE